MTYSRSNTYFPPNDLLDLLSHMPQLETLRVSFSSTIPSCDVKRQLLLTPITTDVILPNLRWFGFGGVSAYLEALLPQITAHLLEKFQILFIDQLTFSTQYLLQFMDTTEEFRCGNAKFRFYEDGVAVWVNALRGANRFSFTCILSVGPPTCRPRTQRDFFVCSGQYPRRWSTLFSSVGHYRLSGTATSSPPGGEKFSVRLVG